MRVLALPATATRKEGACRAAFAAVSLLLWTSLPAAAEEPRGCDKFAWDLSREGAALGRGDLAEVRSGATQTVASGPVRLRLSPSAEAALPKPPERASKQPDARSGFLRFAAPEAGLYQVSLSGAAWIDVVQDGTYLKPVRFTGALDCPGVRKSVRFEIGPAPFILQVSGTPLDEIGIVVAPAP